MTIVTLDVIRITVFNVAKGTFPIGPKFTGRGGLGIGASFGGNPFRDLSDLRSVVSNPAFHYDLKGDDDNNQKKPLTNIYNELTQYAGANTSFMKPTSQADQFGFDGITGIRIEGIKEGDIIHYDKHAGHGIQHKDKFYGVIKQMDVVLID